MGAALAKQVIYCPRCNREFAAIPGSECFCACGAAFRVKPDGRGADIIENTGVEAKGEGERPRSVSFK